MRIRVAGLFIDENKLLTVEHKKNEQIYYLLPGGGVEENEILIDALKREFLEELSIQIDVGDLLFMGESIGQQDGKKRHIMQIVFHIKAISGEIKVNPDERLYGFKFLKTDEINQVTFYPQCHDQLLAYINQYPELKHYDLYQWS